MVKECDYAMGAGSLDCFVVVVVVVSVQLHGLHVVVFMSFPTGA